MSYYLRLKREKTLHLIKSSSLVEIISVDLEKYTFENYWCILIILLSSTFEKEQSP